MNLFLVFVHDFCLFLTLKLPDPDGFQQSLDFDRSIHLTDDCTTSSIDHSALFLQWLSPLKPTELILTDTSFSLRHHSRTSFGKLQQMFCYV